MENLFWHGGRLEGVLDNKAVSLSLDEAYNLIPKDERIAEACYDVLKPYGKWQIKKVNDLIARERKRENG